MEERTYHLPLPAVESASSDKLQDSAWFSLAINNGVQSPREEATLGAKANKISGWLASKPANERLMSPHVWPVASLGQTSARLDSSLKGNSPQ